MNLTFKQLSIKHFKSIVEVELKLDRQPGLHFIRGENLVEPRLGSNGSSKSSLFDALCWCLFGKTPSGLRNPDIVPWGNKKSTTSITLEFGIGTELYQLCRTYNPGTLTIDGDQCSQEEIESLLGFNFDLFINTIILAQGQPLFFDRPPREKMQLFTDVLALDKWETRAGAAKDKADDYDRQVTNATAQVESLKSELLTIKDMFQEYSARSAEWKGKHEQRLVELKDELKEELARLETIEAKHNKASLAYDSAATELKSLKDTHQPIVEKLRTTERNYDSATSKITRAEEDLKRLKRQLADLKQTKICPTCGQPVKQEDFSEHRKELQEQIHNTEAVINNGITEDIAQEYLQAKKEYDNVINAQREFEQKAFDRRQQVDYLTPDLARARAEVSKLQNILDELERETNPYRDRASKLEEKLTLIKEDIEDGENYTKRVREKAERTRYWVKGFKDIRLFVIEEVLEELELTSKIILEDIGLIDWKIQYEVERETKSGTVQRGINITIHSPSNVFPVKWESWSGGEGQRLRLVGALALSEVLLGYAGITNNLEVLDEPTRHLSKEGVRDVWNYLAERSERLDRVCFYIDHATAQSALFASTITVTKDKSGVHIQDE